VLLPYPEGFFYCRNMKFYKFTLTYAGKPASSNDNKLGPLIRKYSGSLETKYNYDDNETIVSIKISAKENKQEFQKELQDPKYSFLTFEKVILSSDED